MNFEKLKQIASNKWEEIVNPSKVMIFIGMGTCGKSAGAEEVEAELFALCRKKKIDFEIIHVGCIGLCYLEPLVDVVNPAHHRGGYLRRERRGILIPPLRVEAGLSGGVKPNSARICFGNVTVKNLTKIVDYILHNKIPKELVIGTIGEKPIDGIPKLSEIPFMKHQVRRVLARCGFIDPENIYHYIANNGYSGLEKALKMSPEEIIEEIKKSSLRGRGGAGFPTWQKWETCRKTINELRATSHESQSYIVCNANESSPGAFMNCALLESDPHSVLEGMLIAGYAIGAKNGYIYCRAEYPLALKRLKIAIEQMRKFNLFGEKILSSDFNFNIHIKEGVGAFVCGEETALISSIEGKRGMPHSRPPFPAEKGLFGCPTVINNVETFANVSLILQNGAKWFAELGTEKISGTKTFCLIGKIKKTGLIEVPLGTKLKQVVYDIGDGIAGDKKFKAIQIGGPSGGCLPANLLDLPIDYESLTSAGAIMGSGGMIVFDEDNCAVDLAKYFLNFTQQESCGKCVPCRVGTKQMLNILEKIADGLANQNDLKKLCSLADTIQATALCGLGKTAPNPVLTTLKYFYDEYESHIEEKKCPSVVCKDLVTAACRNTCPAEIDVPHYIRLINEGKYSDACAVIREKVPFPGVLGRVCYHPCESKCLRKDIDEAVAIKTLKLFVANNDTGLWKKTLKKSPSSGKKVAVIGSGPCGLTAAYFLVLKGHKVVVYEESDVPGGMLNLFPEYRLPKKILRKEIADIKSAGVKIKTATKVDSLDELFNKGYDAIFVAVGAQENVALAIGGENEKGVYDSLDFLKRINSWEKIKLGSSVIIIGGGNVAIDSARTSIRLGAKNVKIIYRRTRKEMPAYPEEIKSAVEEKIKIVFLHSPKRIWKENGKLKLECVKMQLGEVDFSGRRKPIPIPGSEVVFNADTVVVAAGQKVKTNFPTKVDRKTLATDIKGVFAGGDCVRGASSVVEAIADGRTAAGSIDKYLGGNGIIDQMLSFEQGDLKVPEITEKKKRQIKMPCINIAKRLKGFSEVELGYGKKDAFLESQRCLKCDLGKIK